MTLQKVRTIPLTLSRLARLILALGKLSIHVMYWTKYKFQRAGGTNIYLELKMEFHFPDQQKSNSSVPKNIIL